MCFVRYGLVPLPLMLSPGQRIGPYTVTAPLRSGGMASLYLAQRVGPAGFARKVALKVIHAHLSQDAQFVRMFLDEALLCARIRHPNVVHVEELGEHRGAYFLAMEFVDGFALSELLDQLCTQGEMLDPQVAVSIACSVLEGLRAVHELRGENGEPLSVVHRDVSPSNILIDRVGHVKLIDFGVAKARGRAVETSAGTLKGKYAYMAPEQAFGRDVDQRADLYALGVVLWEMLALRPLFAADNDLALLDQVRAPAVPSLCAVAPHISPELDKAVRWALAPSRDERAPSAWELRQALLTAMPEARVVDGSQIAALLTRLGRDSEVPGLLAADGSTVSSTPFGRSEKTDMSLSQAAGTNVGDVGRRGARWLVAVLVAVIAVILVGGLWAFGSPTKREVNNVSSPVAAPSVTEPQGPEKTPSLAAPPHEVAPQPTNAPTTPMTQVNERKGDRSTPRRVRRPAKGTSKGGEDRAPSGIDGVPLVDKPGF